MLRSKRIESAKQLLHRDLVIPILRYSLFAFCFLFGAASAQADWPDATNTGYRNAPGYPGSLTPWTGGAIQSNQTYNFVDFAGGVAVGSVANPVSNVTFHGCRFKGTHVGGALVPLFGDNITFEYCSFEPGNASPPTAFNQSYQYGLQGNGGYYSFIQKLTVTNSDFWGFGNAIDTGGSTQAKPHVFRDNWIHDAAADGGFYHTDGIGNESDSGQDSYVVIDHNTIESLGNTNGIAYQRGVYDHFTITNNLLGGFGYTVAVWAPAPNTIFTGNTFSTRLPVVYGPLYNQFFWTSSGSVWQCNKWKVPAGAAWGDPAHDGWFWIPDDSATSGSTDNPFVSATDYLGNTTCAATPPNLPGYCATGGPPLWQNLEACGWPGPTNTGYTASTTLANTSGRTITTNNTVINGERINGQLIISAQNVTVRNSYISWDGGGAGGSGVIKLEAGSSALIDHVEINGLNHTHACVWHEGSSVTVRGVNCYGVNDGFFSWNQNTGRADSGDFFTLQDTYIHHLTVNAANGHMDGYQSEGAAHGHILHNTFDLPGNVSSALAIWNSQKNSDDWTIENNLFTGGGFTLYAEDYVGPGNTQAAENVANSAVGGYSLMNTRFLNNKFSTSQYPHTVSDNSSCVGVWGTWFYRGNWPPYYGGPTDLWNQGGSIRSGNVVLETGQNIDRGGPAGCEGANTSPAAPAGGGPRCDVNSDGSTNVSDVQLCVNQAIGISGCSTGDINQDSQCNVVDVQRVVNAALGGQCVTQ